MEVESTSGRPDFDGHRSQRTPVLSANGLRKSYGRRQALKGLTFSVDAGRILGFLGPNGAGKTTAIRILTTILPPDEGTFTVAGVASDDPAAIRRRIGVLPESMGFPKGTPAADYLTFYGQMYGLDRRRAQAGARDLLEEVGLSGRAQSAIGSYSRGMRQRLGIARALVNDPAVVFLDEPTLGLDPRGQQELLATIRRIAEDRAVGVVLCSHALVEVENVCDDVIILNLGEVVASGTVAQVIGGAGGMHTAAVRRVRVSPREVDAAVVALRALPGVTEAVAADPAAGWLRLEVMDEDSNNRILAALIDASISILGFEPGLGRLEDVFLQLTEGAST